MIFKLKSKQLTERCSQTTFWKTEGTAWQQQNLTWHRSHKEYLEVIGRPRASAMCAAGLCQLDTSWSPFERWNFAWGKPPPSQPVGLFQLTVGGAPWAGPVCYKRAGSAWRSRQWAVFSTSSLHQLLPCSALVSLMWWEVTGQLQAEINPSLPRLLWSQCYQSNKSPSEGDVKGEKQDNGQTSSNMENDTICRLNGEL